MLGGEKMKIKDLPLKEQYKRINEKHKLKYDRYGVALPKGTKNKITAKGESVNGLINKLVKKWIEENYNEGE